MSLAESNTVTESLLRAVFGIEFQKAMLSRIIFWRLREKIIRTI